ncbi:MAG: hypothetical protein MJ158_02675 [Alphaproteobacteria bacterium]|nr:hypothetical protein [Alphaproteobacteria bacterium]
MAKTTKKTSTKKNTVIKVTAPVEHTCSCGCHCKCRAKKILVLILVFALGFMCAKSFFCPCPMKHHNMYNVQMQNHKKMQKFQHPIFKNGCLEKDSIKDARMLEVIADADVNADNCISIEEYKNARRTHHKNHKNDARVAPTSAQ